MGKVIQQRLRLRFVLEAQIGGSGLGCYEALGAVEFVTVDAGETAGSEEEQKKNNKGCGCSGGAVEAAVTAEVVASEARGQVEAVNRGVHTHRLGYSGKHTGSLLEQ